MADQTDHPDLYETEHYSVPFIKKNVRNIRNKVISKEPYTAEELASAHDGFVQIQDLFAEFGWADQVSFAQPDTYSRVANITFKPFTEFTNSLAPLIIEFGRADEKKHDQSQVFSWMRNDIEYYRTMEAARVRKSHLAFATFHLQQGIMTALPIKDLPLLNSAIEAAIKEDSAHKLAGGRTTVDTFVSIMHETHRFLIRELQEGGFEVTPHNTLALMLGHIANSKNLQTRAQQGDVTITRAEYMEFITNGVNISKALLYVSPLLSAAALPSAQMVKEAGDMPFAWFMKINQGFDTPAEIK
jgi:hypothetical protein